MKQKLPFIMTQYLNKNVKGYLCYEKSKNIAHRVLIIVINYKFSITYFGVSPFSGMVTY